MTDPTRSHDPAPEFLTHLEWQIETAMRRESRLAEPVTGGGGFSRWRGLTTAALVAAALAIGGAAGIASEHLQDIKVRDQILANTLAETELAATRLDLARAEYQEARRRFEAGTVTPESLAATERRVRALEAALKRLQIDIEETKATSAPPRNELNAPRVGQRDFVRERLLLDLGAAEQDLAAAEEAAKKARERFEIGLESQAGVLHAEAAMGLARDRMEKVRVYINLREKYLQQAIRAEDLAASARRTELMVDLSRAKNEYAAARTRLETIRKQSEVGMASQLDVKRAEVDLLEMEVKLQTLQRQLAALKKE